jgi:hypothetical protein
MGVAADRESRLVAFLLGTLPELEHAELEERLFQDDGAQEELETAADDLIHAYLAGTLTADQRSAFEGHFLKSARHRERLAFIRDLVTATRRVSASAPAPAAPPVPASAAWPVPWPLAAAIAVAAAGAVAVVLTREATPPVTLVAHSPSPSPPIPSPPTDPSVALASPVSPPPTPRPLVSPAQPDEGGRIQVVRLPDAATPSVTELRLGTRTRTVRLEVPVAEEAPSYDAVLRDASAREAWRAEGIAPSAPGRPLVLAVPAAAFAAGDYVVSVEGEALRGESPAAAVERRLRVLRPPP